MHNADPPPADQLPSTRALLRSTAIALVAALVLLVTVVLPAEYAIDPTGIGRILGLTEMGEVKMALAEEAAVAEAAEAALAAGQPVPPAAAISDTVGTAGPDTGAAPGVRTDSTRITLTPGQGAEIKLAMDDGAEVEYHWEVTGGVVNHDTHGDILNAPPGFYHGYSRGTAMQADQGVLVAAFDGTHGWFWRNRGSGVVDVTLRVRGNFHEMTRLE